MSTDVRVETLIALPRADVAAYMFDPANDAEWTTGVVASRPLQPGPLVAGSVVERDVRFAGRRFSYRYEVVAAEAAAFVEMQVERPFPMVVRYELFDRPEGTAAAIQARGEAGGFFRLTGPLLNRMVRRNITKDLAQLRDRLESGRGPAADRL